MGQISAEFNSLRSLVASALASTNVIVCTGPRPSELDAPAIEEYIAARAAAKQAKAFEKADAIRAELLKQGVVLEDKPGGITEWRRA